MAAPRFRTNQDGSTTYFGADPAAAGGGDLFSINQAGNVLSLLDPAFHSIPRNYLAASKETISDPQWLAGDFAGLNLQAPAAWFDATQAHPEFLRTRYVGDAEGWNEGSNTAPLGDFIQMGTRTADTDRGGTDAPFVDGPAGGYIRRVWETPDQLRYVVDVYDQNGNFSYRDLMDDHGEEKTANFVGSLITNVLGLGWVNGLYSAMEAEDRGDESGIYKGLLSSYGASGAPGSNYAAAASGAWNAYDAYERGDYASAVQTAYGAYNAANSDPNGSRWKTGTVGGDLGTTGVDDFRQGEIAGYSTNGSMPTSAATVGGNQDLGGQNFGGGNVMWNTGYFDDGVTNDWDSSSLNDSQQVSLSDYGMEDFLGQFAGNDQNWWDSLLSGKNAGLLGNALKIYNGLGGNKALGGLLGAYLGYKEGKDGKQEMSQRAPWEPMQPYLKGLASEGADLFAQFKAQPFSQAEQAAYANTGNVLDFINHAAPDLMSGFDANASGRNQFVRGQPRTLLGSNYTANGNPVAWQPGLLGSFGTGNNPRR